MGGIIGVAHSLVNLYLKQIPVVNLMTINFNPQ